MMIARMTKDNVRRRLWYSDCADDIAEQGSNTATKNDDQHKDNHRDKHQKQGVFQQALPGAVFLIGLRAVLEKAQNELDHIDSSFWTIMHTSL